MSRGRTKRSGPAGRRGTNQCGPAEDRESIHSEPAGRRALLTAGMLMIPIVFLALLEGGLRLSGFGDAYPLFVPVPGFEEYRVPNPDVGRRYFARTRAVPGPPHDVFREAKQEGSVRIFVQGGSTAAGFPYGHGATIARILRRWGSWAEPGREIEVVSTAMDAVSSAVLADLGPEIVAERPDAVFVYAGHNEFYGALGVASTESLGESDVLVRLYLRLDGLRIVQLLRDALARVAGPSVPDSATPPTLMEELARDRLVPPGSGLRTRAERRFEGNLRRLLCGYREAGVAAFVGTLVSNERGMPPLVTTSSPGVDTVAYGAARALVARAISVGDLPAALEAADRVVALDSLSAAARYGRARLLERAGRVDEASEDYRAAIDLDALPFRAPSAMNAAIRRSAAACGAVVVEVHDALAAASPDGIVGSELMLEHLHPNLDGYALLGEAFYRSLAAAGILGSAGEPLPPAGARPALFVTELDSTLASLHVRRLLGSWPFRRQAREDTFRVSTEVDRLAVEVLQGRLAWDAATGRLGAMHQAAGDLQRALRAALALVDEYPHRGPPLVAAGHVLVRMGRMDEALRTFAAAASREPTAESLRMTGQVLTRLGRAGEASGPLERAAVLAPESPDVLYDLGVAYVALGRVEEARAVAGRILAVAPDHPGALRLRDATAVPPPG